jgi:ABC-type antimicrobial peptide transport system permease subunit
LKQTDARITPLGITTMNDLIHYSAGRFQIAAELGAVLGILGLVLTAVGLFGVVSYGISQRAVELGIRMALGAGPRETRLLVLKEVATLGVAGAAIGLPLASASTHLLASMLFGVGPWDPPAFAGSAVLLMAVLLMAGFIPARRATAVAPASVLRSA